MKLCSDCRHSQNNAGDLLCTRIVKGRSLIDGSVIYEFRDCYTERYGLPNLRWLDRMLNGKRCGLDGRYFEKEGGGTW